MAVNCIKLCVYVGSTGSVLKEHSPDIERQEEEEEEEGKEKDLPVSSTHCFYTQIGSTLSPTPPVSTASRPYRQPEVLERVHERGILEQPTRRGKQEKKKQSKYKNKIV